MYQGLMRGLQQIADFFHLLNWAIHEKNEPALLDCQTVANAWLAEARDTGIKIGVSPWQVLFGDPFRNSRALLEKMQAKYGR